MTHRPSVTALTSHLRCDILELQAHWLSAADWALTGGLLCRQFANRHRHFLGFTIATQRHRHVLAYRGLGHQRWQVVRIFNRFVVKAHNHITRRGPS
jgi:hypothetical protein